MAIIAYKFYCYQNQKIICMAFISNYCHQSQATDIDRVVLLSPAHMISSNYLKYMIL